MNQQPQKSKPTTLKKNAAPFQLKGKPKIEQPSKSKHKKTKSEGKIRSSLGMRNRRPEFTENKENENQNVRRSAGKEHLNRTPGNKLDLSISSVSSSTPNQVRKYVDKSSILKNLSADKNVSSNDTFLLVNKIMSLDDEDHQHHLPFHHQKEPSASTNNNQSHNKSPF